MKNLTIAATMFAVSGWWTLAAADNPQGKAASEPLKGGAVAVLAPLEWETAELKQGSKAFLDVDFTFEVIPVELRGQRFIRSNFYGTRVVCVEPGVVYAVTPARETGRFSRAEELERIGFEEAGCPPFQIFGSQWPELPCAVYRKQVVKGERIDLGSPGIVLKDRPAIELSADVRLIRARWCLILAETPRARGKVGDLQQRSGSTFDPPLAQDYSIAARMPSLAYFNHDPGMIRLPSGDFLAFSPCWSRRFPSAGDTGPRPHRSIILTKSSDGGKTWRRLPDLPYAEATPFLAQGKLYLFTQPQQHQDVYFMRSGDEGETWSEPIKVIEGPYWNCQTSMVEKDGFLYWVLDKRHQGTVAIAGDLSMDLLDPKAWRMSNVLDPVMTPAAFRPSGADARTEAEYRDWNLEGNVMLVGDRLRIAARVNPMPGGATPALATLFDLEDKDGTLLLSYDQHYPWPGGQTKFAIIHDPKTRLFWMACNLVTGFRPELGNGARGERRYLMLYFGSDGMNWMPAGCVAMAPTASQSFMYPSMVLDGDDLVLLSRSGRESGHFHDADLSTFHRIKDFRSLAWY